MVPAGFHDENTPHAYALDGPFDETTDFSEATGRVSNCHSCREGARRIYSLGHPGLRWSAMRVVEHGPKGAYLEMPTPEVEYHRDDAGDAETTSQKRRERQVQSLR